MKKLTCRCGARFDPQNWDGTKTYSMCWKCWSTQPMRITENEGYASQKDYEESTLK